MKPLDTRPPPFESNHAYASNWSKTIRSSRVSRSTSDEHCYFGATRIVLIISSVFPTLATFRCITRHSVCYQSATFHRACNSPHSRVEYNDMKVMTPPPSSTELPTSSVRTLLWFAMVCMSQWHIHVDARPPLPPPAVEDRVP